MKNIFIIILFLLGTLVHGQITLIPDPYFEQALINLGIDSDGVINGQVLTSDIENVVTLPLQAENISDLTGIEDFAALEWLDINHNNLTSFDLSQNTLLRTLYCQSNGLEALDLSNNTLLEELSCGNPNYDVGDHNVFTSLDLSNNLQLWLFNCGFAFDLESINFGQNPNLMIIFGYYCNLSSINFGGIPNLEVLDLGFVDPDITGYSNNFTEIDLSGNPFINVFSGRNMNLESLNVQSGNNAALTTLIVTLSPDLSCIQVDDEIAANSGEPPYNGWFTDPGVIYSEDCTLGIEDFQEDIVILYPNPVKDVLHIVGKDLIKEVLIYNILGQAINHFTPGVASVEIDTSNLSKGFYIIKVSINGQIGTYEIIK